MPNIELITRGKSEYNPDGKTVNEVIAVEFDQPVDPKDIYLSVSRTDKEKYRIIKPKLADRQDASEENPRGEFEVPISQGRFMHFALKSLPCGSAYSYKIKSRSGQPIRISPAHGEDHPHRHERVHCQAPPELGKAQNFSFATTADQECMQFLRDCSASELLSKWFRIPIDQRRATLKIYREIAQDNPDLFIINSDLYNIELEIDFDNIFECLHYDSIQSFEEAVPEDFQCVVRDMLQRIISTNTRDDHDYKDNGASKASFKEHAKRYYNAMNYLNTIMPQPTVPEDNHQGNFFKQSYGAAELYHLNGRVYKDENSLFGDAQKQWLESQLSASTAQAKFIFTPLGLGPGKNPDEDLRGYPSEWKWFLQLCAQHGVSGIYTSDSHFDSLVNWRVKVGDEWVIIPQMQCGTAGGTPQCIKKPERKSITHTGTPYLPLAIADDANFSGDVLFYYTPMRRASEKLLGRTSRSYRAFTKDQGWCGKNNGFEPGQFGWVRTQVDYAAGDSGKFILNLFKTQCDSEPENKTMLQAEFPLKPKRVKI